MSNDVFANGLELSCKAGAGKSIAAFPDVCFTPPENPTTPPGVPIPYPNTGMASDTTEGSASVKVSDKEVTLKNKSYFKKSSGDEAGSAAKKGVVTSVNRGKVYFNSWSMDVKIEGENVVRHTDLTTHNHASFPGNAPPWPFLDQAAFDGTGPCKGEAKKIKEKCLKTEKDKNGDEVYSLLHTTKDDEVKRKATVDEMCGNKACNKAMACVLTPYSPSNCCDGKTGHHVVPKSQFKEPGDSGKEFFPGKYKPNKAPCICVEGHDANTGDHGQVHSLTNAATRKATGTPANANIDPDERWTLGEAERTGAEAVEEAIGCPADCIEEQLRNGHMDMGITKASKVRPTTAGATD